MSFADDYAAAFGVVEGSWLDPADVASWLRLGLPPPSGADVEMARVCAAAELYVQRCRPEFWNDAEEPLYVPDEEVSQGAIMYAAREYRRGTTFVSKYDSDIERALRTGMWNRPGVG